MQRREYYAQPQNGFWRIMEDLFGISRELPYEARTQALLQRGVALWDVCRAAHRPGSLDIAIRKPESNDFAGFLAANPGISLICFNGAKASNLYEKLVVPGLSEQLRQIETRVLPSTSAANAAVPYAEKLSRWTIVREELGRQL